MKNVSRILMPMTLLLFALSGCQSPTSSSGLSNNPLFAPVPEQQPVFTGEYVSVADADTKPEIVGTQTPPVYPVAFNRHNVIGEATIAFIVTVDGKTEQVQVVKATHRGFADAAMESVKKWRYTPATKDGKPVNCLMQLPISFDLGR